MEQFAPDVWRDGAYTVTMLCCGNMDIYRVRGPGVPGGGKYANDLTEGASVIERYRALDAAKQKAQDARTNQPSEVTR